MTNEPQAQPPERIWIQPVESNLLGVGPIWFTRKIGEGDIEYVRADLPRAAADDARLEQIKAKYSNTADPSATYRVDANDLAWLINEVELSTPRVETGLTVEAALKELREMFPRHYCSISHEGRLVLGMSWKLKKIETVARIRITSATIEDAMLPVEADADTLNEAMDQVRAWVKSRAERERNDE